MVDVSGLALTKAEQKLLAEPAVGGLILFTRNYKNPEQLTQLIKEIRSIKPEILIAVDHEGGRIQRFREGFTTIPSHAALGQYYLQDKETGFRAAKAAGWVMASELLALGIDMSFAPVVDLDHGISEVIGDRAFSADANLVIELAKAYMLGMQTAGMQAVIKHFPGHGAVAADSHHTLPVDERTLAVIEQTDLQPFRSLIVDGVNALMPAHVVYPAVDEKPVAFSSYWIQQYLRGQLGYRGAIFSDDLAMAGAAGMGEFEQRAELALRAGCDMVLVCNNTDAAQRVVTSLADYQLSAESVSRLAKMHGQRKLSWDSLRRQTVWQQAVARLEQLESDREPEAEHEY